MPFTFNPLQGEFNISKGGTVVNPSASSTDDALVRWSGTSGTIVQDSGWILDDSDQMTIPTGVTAGMCFGDGDTCIYEDSDDVLKIDTASTTAITIDASQDITFSGVVSGATQLNVDNLRLDGDTMSSTDTNGNITLSPDGTGYIITMRPLVVNSALGEINIIIAGITINGSLFLHSEGSNELGDAIIQRHTDTAGFGAHQIMARSRGNEITETAVQNNDLLSQILSVGHDGTDYEQAAVIKVEVDGTPGAGDMPGRIIMMTSADGAATPIEGFRLDNTQTVTLANPLPASSGGRLEWSVETGTTRALVINEGVVGNNGTGITMTLPTTAAVGSIIKITNIGAGLVTIAQNAGESINVVGSTTTVGVGGSLVMTEQFDSIEIVNVVADTTWNVLSMTGNFTIV